MSDYKSRAFSANDLISWFERKELILQPKFQRREVWSSKARSHLIDTIIRGLPIPLIFIRQTLDPVKRKTLREVVDGQQRLSALIAYRNNEFKLLKSQNQTYGGLTFQQLPSDVQTAFLDYEFSVVVLGNMQDESVLDVFARLNTYAQKLTPQELLNSKYYGLFKQVVYKLGYEHLEFWRNNKILNDKSIMRMGEAELTTEILVAMLYGVQRRRTRTEEAYRENDDEFKNGNKVRAEFHKVIDFISECMGASLKGSLYSKRNVFPSLYCSVYHLFYGIPATPEISHKGGRFKKFSVQEVYNIKESLLELERLYKSAVKTIAKKGDDTKVRLFADACRKATSEKESRVTRINTILDFMLKALK